MSEKGFDMDDGTLLGMVFRGEKDESARAFRLKGDLKVTSPWSSQEDKTSGVGIRARRKDNCT